jgi:hypothetical protein
MPVPAARLRLYSGLLKEHSERNRQMAFVSGSYFYDSKALRIWKEFVGFARRTFCADFEPRCIASALLLLASFHSALG